MEKNKDHSKYELRSQEVQELLGLVPRWIIRWGTLIIFLVLIIMFIISRTLAFPDIISSQIQLTANIPPAEMKSYTDGIIKKILINEQQTVKKGELLAVIHSSAKFEDVLYLSQVLADTFSLEYIINTEIENAKLNLGDLQQPFSLFVNVLEDYKSFVDIDYYRRKLAVISTELKKQKKYIRSVDDQSLVLEEEFNLIASQFNRDSSLYIQGVLSKNDLEKSKENKLNKLYEWKESVSLLNQSQIQITKLDQQKLELELQLEKENQKLYSLLKAKWEELRGNIAVWRKKHFIESPFEGRVVLNKIWSENQYVKEGDIVLIVLPKDFESIVGRITLGSSGYGKVKKGNRVIIMFDNYPYLEYGVVTGTVNTLSLAPEGGKYYASVKLDSSRLVTNYGSSLRFIQNMQGRAEIVTESRSLFRRIVAPLKSAIEIQEMYKD
jgi:HlyD family secretion protein